MLQNAPLVVVLVRAKWFMGPSLHVLYEFILHNRCKMLQNATFVVVLFRARWFMELLSLYILGEFMVHNIIMQYSDE